MRLCAPPILVSRLKKVISGRHEAYLNNFDRSPVGSVPSVYPASDFGGVDTGGDSEGDTIRGVGARGVDSCDDD
jgi:hypothetical protein